jgi:hypothetical protein
MTITISEMVATLSYKDTRAIQRPFLGIKVDIKKKRVGYPSVMHFEGRLASGPEEICDLIAEFIQRTYTDDVWVPSDPGPEHVPDDPPYGALQMRLRAFCRIWMSTSSGPDGIPPIILRCSTRNDPFS